MSRKIINIYKKIDVSGNETIYFSPKDIPSEYTKQGINQCTKGTIKKHRGCTWEKIEACRVKYCTDCNTFLSNVNLITMKSNYDKRSTICKKCHLVRCKISRNKNLVENMEKSRLATKKYREDAKDCDHKRAIVNQNRAKRRASKLMAKPKWLTKQHIRDMVNIYKESKLKNKESGIEHHVDHIIPLQGKTVCGLHVPWNLQILTRDENLKKSNKLIIGDLKCHL